MIRMGRKATASRTMIAIAGLLAAVSSPLYAAEDMPKPKSPRLIDLSTCAKPDYPKADLRANHMGMVTILFLVAPDGIVKDSKISKSSGYESLDEAARTALAACRFAPAGATTDAPVWLPVQYKWVIEPNGAGAPTMSPAAQENAFLWTARVLARYRYKPVVQASTSSAPVLDLYLKALDPEHVLFTRSDVADLDPQREQLARSDDSKQLSTAFAIFEQMRARRIAMLTWTGEAIRGPLSALGVSGPGPRTPDAPWPASDDERQALWRRRAADEVRSLRNAGTSEKNIVAVLTRRYDNHLARIRALTTHDAFEIFMNAYVGAFDPHGAYLSPLGKPLSRFANPDHVGIGLTVKKRGEWITVEGTVADGSALRSGQLHSGDRIVAVAQGAGQPMTDVVGWSVDEVVTLLRGLPGSTVVMNVIPAGAQVGSAPRSVALVRGQVSSRNDASHPRAKVEVLDRNGISHRIAVVTIPTFYQDVAAKRAGIGDYASVTRDVAELLATMKTQRVDAVLLDMRGNGGGTIGEATGLAGLFLPRAPVALQREREGKIKVEFAPDSIPAWDGPLAVLIDEGSAAGTEIFAAAIQDHGRGIVIGDRSFGRSSIQTLISLDRFAPNPSEHYGELKMTIAQAYRATGESFEQTGIIPDIAIPGVPASSGNAHQLAFPTVPISPTPFDRRGEIKAVLPTLARRHETRTAGDTSYQAMLRARTQSSGDDGAAGADIVRVQLGEALHVVGDEVELLRASPVTGR
jgi:carboxyl-terminal processing protease